MESYWIHRLSPFVWEFSEGVGIRWYGVSYVLSFLLGARLYKYLSIRRFNPMRPGQVADFITWAAVFGVMMGGRIGYVLLYDMDRVFTDPWSVFRVWEGGMASHGGILGLVLFTFVWSRKVGVSWRGIGDSLVVVAPIGMLLVRIANFINGELYGRVTHVPWAVQFPTELRDHPELLRATSLAGYPVDELLRRARMDDSVLSVLREVLPPRHPSQLYEAALEGGVLFLALWLLRTRCSLPRGAVTGAFFVLYAVLRIFGEQFRQPEDYNFGMPRGVFLSLFLILIGIAFLVWAFSRPEYEVGCKK